ncbi:hypothetical protein PV04_02079 [Phialophora macrospora]|uniref:Uncharacterized protein n=1 Tax=Phialophora macrospora TaxID=1851006 RepID=A0A0D2FZT4_9EURO|nr:hypothetical protein PV04_02079 [Phialophora macrospora]
MPDEHWRAEIHETALLLAAVASGDRSRVVKQLTDYLLAKDGGNQDPDEAPEEEHGHYEEYEGYVETYAEDGDQYVYENDDYQHDGGYNNEYEAEDYAGADDGYQGEAYMSGAYNEVDEGDDAYHREAYTEDYDYDNNYNPTTYARQDPSGADAYKTGSHAGSGDGYDENSWYQDQQYDPTYYEQDVNAYDGQNDQEWNGEGGQYPGQNGAMSYGGGEWSQEADYGLRSDDQIQVVDEVDNARAEQLDADEMYPYPQEDTYGTEDPGYTEEQENPESTALYREIQVYPDPNDPSPVYAPLPIERQRSQRQQPYPDDDRLPYIITPEPPPEYSELPHEVASRTPIGMTPVQAPELESRGVGGNVNGAYMQAPRPYDNGAGARGPAEDDDEDAAWEDERCREDEEVLSPASPGSGDLQFNPLSRIYAGPRLAMPMPPMAPSRFRSSWEQ